MRNLDVPCRIAVLGSQMWDDSMQCRMVDRSAHVSKSKAKQKKQKQKKTQQNNNNNNKKENNPNNKTRNVQ